MIQKLLLSTIFTLIAATIANASPQDRKEALAVLQPEIADYQKNCPDETIQADSIKDTLLTSSKTAVAITLSSSGFCFGNTAPAYLITPVNGKWKMVGWWFRGLEIKPLTVGQRAATIIGYGIGMCHVTYLWRGNRYVAIASKDCGDMSKQRDINNTAADLTKAALQ
jgi:hypothetical protein